MPATAPLPPLLEMPQRRAPVPNDRPPPRSRLEPLATALAVALIAVAFGLAWRAAAGLDWPCEMDFFRDMGGAQAMLDGLPGADPSYLGEFNWFNPLQPTVFAGLAWLTGLPLPMLYARCGPFLNLLGPLGFYLLARKLLGRWAALGALTAYLFLNNPAVPSWFQATYSPWAWPMDFAQGFFFLTAAAYVRAVLTRRLRWDVVTGVLLGVTFLAHTAPTLVFVALLLLRTLFSQRVDRFEAWRRLLVVGFVSLAVASPFLGPLVAHYRLHVLNRGPSEHEPIGLNFVLENLLSLRTMLAVVGVVALVAYRAPGRADTSRATILGGLLVAPLLLLGYGLLAQWLFHRGTTLPRVLPTYHFHLYVKAAESLLMGVGLFAVTRWIASRWPMQAARIAGPLTAALTLALVAVYLPGYLSGVELNRFRAESERIGAQADRIAVYRWLLTATDPADVFLTDHDTSVWVVAPAARKVVSMPDQYANIYVSYEARARDNNRLFASLRDRDAATFAELMAQYHVGYVVVTSGAALPERLGITRFNLVLEEGRYRVYRLE